MNMNNNKSLITGKNIHYCINVSTILEVWKEETAFSFFESLRFLAGDTVFVTVIIQLTIWNMSM